MIDIEARIRAHLASLAGLQAVFGKPGGGLRIYAGRNLPSEADVASGPALLIGMRGGGQDFHSQLYVVSVQCRVYAATEAQAPAGERALYDAINDTQARAIAYMRLEDGTMPVLLNDPDTGWPYMLSFYRFHVRNVS